MTFKKDINQMYEEQKELDLSIKKQQGLIGANLTEKRFLALYTELGELSAVLKIFKFWSKDQKPITNAERQNGVEYNPLLDEYVDGFHFILSLGMELEVDTDKVTEQLTYNSKKTFDNEEIIKQFNKVFEYVSRTKVNHAFYVDLFNQYLLLGSLFGFSWVDVTKGYLDKLEINHQRQKQGY